MEYEVKAILASAKEVSCDTSLVWGNNHTTVDIGFQNRRM